MSLVLPKYQGTKILSMQVIIATILLGLSANTWAAPTLIILMLGAYLLTGQPKLPTPRLLYAALLAVPFGLWWQYGLENLNQSDIPVGILNVIGFYMLAIATHHILALDTGGSSDHAVGCTVLSLGVAGAGSKESLLWLYNPLIVLFIILLLVHLRRELITRATANGNGRTRSGPRKYFPYVLAILALATVGWSIEKQFVPQVPKASRWLVDRMMEANFGQANKREDRVTLGSMDLWGGSAASREQVMLWVHTNHLEKYLRGAVYNRYHDGQWSRAGGPREMERYRGGWPQFAREVPGELQQIAANYYQNRPLEKLHRFNGRNVFNTGKTVSETWIATIFAQSGAQQWYYAPLGTHQISSFVDETYTNYTGMLSPEHERSTGGGYDLFKPAMAVELPPVDYDSVISRPLESQLRDAIDFERVMGNSSSDMVKIKTLEGWFANPNNEFKYELGIQITDTSPVDPVLQFLEKKKGHCEYYATTAALMLRAEGIPTRYVTGFVLTEKGAGGNLYIARGKHAHAWVEAWVPPQGWVVVEATPPSSDAPDDAPTTAQQWKEWTFAQFERLKQLLLYGGVTGIMGAAWDFAIFATGLLPIWVWLLLMLMGMAWVFRKRLFEAIFPHAEEAVSDRVRDLRRRLDEAERKLQKQGFIRTPGMTVSVYLREIRNHPLPDSLRGEVVPVLEEFVRERYRRED